MNIKNTFTILLLILTMAGCKEKNKQTHTMDTEFQNEHIFPIGEKLNNAYFTGDAFLKSLLPKDDNNGFALGSVTFEPSARTNWHTHPKGQVLIVTQGVGITQQKGKPAQLIRKGDVINVPGNVEHWHGASADSRMVHIAITNYKGEENVAWMQPVTDEEYKTANEQLK